MNALEKRGAFDSAHYPPLLFLPKASLRDKRRGRVYDLVEGMSSS